MKKTGFTMAEVLITLGIIGVVAAVTAPALVGSYQKSKVPPALKKFINTMEVANQHIITENEASKLSSIFGTIDKNSKAQTEYLNNLTEYVQGTISSKKMNDLAIKPTNYQGKTNNGPVGEGKQTIFNMSSGEDFSIEIIDSKSLSTNKTNAKGSFKGHYATILFDVNGFNTKPNRFGKDIYYFHMDDGGMLIPNGGKLQIKAYGGNDSDPQWNLKNGWNICNEEGVPVGSSCAGSIMDNNWKIIYKY